MNRRTVLKFLGLVPIAPVVASGLLEEKPIDTVDLLTSSLKSYPEIWHCQAKQINHLSALHSTVDLVGYKDGDPAPGQRVTMVNEYMFEPKFGAKVFSGNDIDKNMVYHYEEIRLTVKLSAIPFEVNLGDWLTIRIDRS